jgi:hypothetical protein
MAFKKKFMAKSPLNNYKNPGDYRVFNMGNEASPPLQDNEKYRKYYSKRDMDTYGKLTEDEYIKEAGRQVKERKTSGKWDYKNAPTVTETTKGRKTTRTVDAKDYKKQEVTTKRNIGDKKVTTTTDKGTGEVTTTKEKGGKVKTGASKKGGKLREALARKSEKKKKKKEERKMKRASKKPRQKLGAGEKLSSDPFSKKKKY